MKTILVALILIFTIALAADSAVYTIEVTTTQRVDPDTGLIKCVDWVTIPNEQITWTVVEGADTAWKVFPEISDPSVLSNKPDQKWFVDTGDVLLVGYYELSFNTTALVGLIDLIPKPNRLLPYWMRISIDGSPPSDPFPRVLVGSKKIPRPIPSD